jgi:hypothetical protein
MKILGAVCISIATGLLMYLLIKWIDDIDWSGR